MENIIFSSIENWNDKKVFDKDLYLSEALTAWKHEKITTSEIKPFLELIIYHLEKPVRPRFLLMAARKKYLEFIDTEKEKQW